MTQEDKAKAYDEALKRAKLSRLQLLNIGEEATEIEYIFPELKESEDERISREITEFILTHRIDEPNDIEDTNHWLAWLEKQGEQRSKLVDFDYNAKDSDLQEVTYFIPNGFHAEMDGNKVVIKQGEQKSAFGFNAVDWQPSKADGKIHNIYNSEVEPKFKVGDFIANGYCVGKVIALTDDAYLLDTGQGIPFSCEYNAHLWTIDDARNGDVLMFEGYYNSIVLFQGVGINGVGRINYHCKCDLGNYSFGIQGDVACLGTIEKDAEHYHPATKEQCDLLFSKMHEAGYEWDSENKQLLSLKAEPTREIRGNEGKISPNWTEGDDEMLDIIIAALMGAENVECADYNIMYNWLNSIEQRIKEQQ